jgi:hypothetical protein
MMLPTIAVQHKKTANEYVILTSEARKNLAPVQVSSLTCACTTGFVLRFSPKGASAAPQRDMKARFPPSIGNKNEVFS